MSPAERFAALSERELDLVLSGAFEEAAALEDERARLLPLSDPRDPALRRAARAQALLLEALSRAREDVAAQLGALGQGRSAAQAYARSAAL